MQEIKYLYQQYSKDIYAYLVSITHNPSLSEDLLSETFLSAIKSIVFFKGDSSIKTWLFSIARHKWYEHLRKQKINISLDTLTENYIAENIEEDYLIKEIHQKIIDILNTQDKRTKDIVMMRIEGYSFLEISNKLDISESSARVIDFRAKKKIKELLLREGYSYE
ncbi:MAG: RNA polymerase sigma factor [Oscillospiraceae bacterium]